MLNAFLKWSGRLLLLSALSMSAVAHAGIVVTAVSEKAAGLGLQPRPHAISVCFVGDALVSRPAKVLDVKEGFRRVQSVANVRFYGFERCREPEPSYCFDDRGERVPCDWYPEDIRIALDRTRWNGALVNREIPSTYVHCLGRGSEASWAHFPHVVDQAGFRACPWNMAIGDEWDGSRRPPLQWLNHPLHEIGHAMGLVHEHVHPDFYFVEGPNGKLCNNSIRVPEGRRYPGDYVVLTELDLASVMIYRDDSCGIEGNFGFDGYSQRDKVSLRLLYPEDDRRAQFSGPLVLRDGAPLRLRLVMLENGINVGSVIRDVTWYVGSLRGHGTSAPSVGLKEGRHQGALEYEDFLGRRFSAAFQIEVLSAADFESRMGATAAALSGAL